MFKARSYLFEACSASRGSRRWTSRPRRRDAYRGLFKAHRLPKSNFPLGYNVAPTDHIPIVRIDPRDGEREVVALGTDPVMDEREAKSPSHQRAG